jgi:hypothetical protein
VGQAQVDVEQCVQRELRTSMVQFRVHMNLPRYVPNSSIPRLEVCTEARR